MDLCRLIHVRSSVILLFVLLLPCDCEERVNLMAVVGSSVTFPDPVKEKGYLIFKQKTIASVSKGAFEIEEDIYSNRLHWNSSRHFILSDLQKSDSGFYSIDSKRGTVFNKLYELKVYDPVSAPVVSCLNVSEDTYSLLCSVNKTEQTTLHWFRGEQRVDSSRSGVLLLTAQRRDHTFIYKCVSDNPAETKTITVDITTVCENKTRLIENTDTETKPLYILYAIIATVVIVLLLVFCWIYNKKRCSKQSATLQTQDSVQYAQIMHRKRKDDQPVNMLTPSENSARPEMTTVYDQIQRERMSPTYSNRGGEYT